MMCVVQHEFMNVPPESGIRTSTVELVRNKPASPMAHEIPSISELLTRKFEAKVSNKRLAGRAGRK